VETAVTSLESKLEGLKEFLPKVDKRRGLIDAAGSILKALKLLIKIQLMHITCCVNSK
jgi:hypothetical protein